MATQSVTIDDVNRLLEERSGRSAKELFVAQKMADLPKVYRDQMPDTSDVAQLAASEQQIRKIFRDDFKRLVPFHKGYLQENPDGSLSGPGMDGIYAQMGQAQAQADLSEANAQDEPEPDLSKMTASEKIKLGLSQSRPARTPAQTSTLTNGLVNTQTAQRTKGGSSVSIDKFGQRTPGGVDLSRMSAGQKLGLGLSMSRPAQQRR